MAAGAHSGENPEEHHQAGALGGRGSQAAEADSLIAVERTPRIGFTVEQRKYLYDTAWDLGVKFWLAWRGELAGGVTHRALAYAVHGELLSCAQIKG